VILRVFAMARPRRPCAESAAVIAASGRTGSARQRGARVAQAVTELIARLERIDPSDPEALATRLAAKLSPSPIEYLALDPEINVLGMLFAARLGSFEARECRQISDHAWQIETSKILARVEKTLAARYARLIAQSDFA